jgi:hypothetical protein
MTGQLGVLFERCDDGAFVLSQRQYLLNGRQRFGIDGCKPCATPCAPKKAIDGAIIDMNYASFPYCEAVGILLYLSTHTRSDISSTVGMLGVAMAAPSAQDAVAVKRLMHYLPGARYSGLELGGPEIGNSLHTQTSTGVTTSTANRLLARCTLSAMVLSTGRARRMAGSLWPPRRKYMWLLRVVPRMWFGFVVSYLISNSSRRTPQSSSKTSPSPSNGAPVARAAPSTFISKSFLSTKSCQ